MSRLQRWLLVLVPVALVLSACGGMAGGGGSSGGAAGGGQADVKAANVTIGGRSQSVLTDASGRTLYYFEADAGGKMACTGSCTAEWKPMMASGGAPKAGPGVTGKLSTMPAASGTVATYNGWPLYTYVGDSKAGAVNGEGVDDFGGKWFAVRVDVRPNQSGASPSAPGAPASPTPTSSYGY